MSSCYKCGRDLPAGQVECEDVCQRAGGILPPDQTSPGAIKGPGVFEYAYIDWSKIKTLADLILVMSVIYDGSGVCTDEVADYDKIKHLCEPPVEINLEGDEL